VDSMMPLRVAAFLAGLAIVLGTLYSAVRVFVVPRSENDKLARIVFLTMRHIFDALMAPSRSYVRRDRIMAFYAPVALLVMAAVWLLLVCVGYTVMFWALGAHTLRDAFSLSGSSLLTLGFTAVHGMPQTLLAFSEAALGLMLAALFISYLPTIYQAFARREAAVTMLEVRAGSPPSAVEMLLRYRRIHGLERLSLAWIEWERWFADVEESHTSLGALSFFRSPKASRSWVTAAGAILDAAALTVSTIDIPHDAQADLCIRAGYIALGEIASFFKIPYNPSPKPSDPISISRQEFDVACEKLVQGGLPLKLDRDQAWRDYAGWRVNYDTVLLLLAKLTMAPWAPWSSDRMPGETFSLASRMPQFGASIQVAGSERADVSGITSG
jgi:hypothetical protein